MYIAFGLGTMVELVPTKVLCFSGSYGVGSMVLAKESA